MIAITASCDQDGCGRQVTLSVGSDQLYSNISVKQVLPRGWRTFTPRQQIHAAIYCPEHS